MFKKKHCESYQNLHRSQIQLLLKFNTAISLSLFPLPLPVIRPMVRVSLSSNAHGPDAGVGGRW